MKNGNVSFGYLQNVDVDYESIIDNEEEIAEATSNENDYSAILEGGIDSEDSDNNNYITDDDYESDDEINVGDGDEEPSVDISNEIIDEGERIVNDDDSIEDVDTRHNVLVDKINGVNEVLRDYDDDHSCMEEDSVGSAKVDDSLIGRLDDLEDEIKAGIAESSNILGENSGFDDSRSLSDEEIVVETGVDSGRPKKMRWKGG